MFQPRRPGLAPIWSHLSDRGTPKTIPQKVCKEDAAKEEAVTTKWDSHSDQDKEPEVVLVVSCGSLEDNSA